jgi:ATP-dependent DNA ligase
LPWCTSIQGIWGRRYHRPALPAVVPQLLANDAPRALRKAIADPDRYACEPKVDGVRGLVVYGPEHTIETRNRRGERRDWLPGDDFERGLRRLAQRLPNIWAGTVLDGRPDPARHRPPRPLRQERRERLELLVRAFDVPLELSPIVEPSVGLVEAMADGRLEGIVLKDRTSTYRDGSRAPWTKIKDRRWYDREARFDRR